MTTENPSSSQPSKGIRIEGTEKITIAEGMPPITVNWEASSGKLRTEMVLGDGESRSTSVIEIPVDKQPSSVASAAPCQLAAQGEASNVAAVEASASAEESQSGQPDNAVAATAVAAASAAALGSALASEAREPGGEPSLAQREPDDEPPLAPDEPAEDSAELTRALIDEPSLVVLPITPSAVDQAQTAMVRTQEELSSQVTQSIPVVATDMRQDPSYSVALPSPQSPMFDEDSRAFSIPAEKLDKKGRPKKRHRVRNIILTIIIVFLLYEIGGVILSPLVLPYSDVGTETLPETFGQSTDASQERIMYLGSDNVEALNWRLKIIADAQEEICFESLDLRNDESSHDIMAALYAAAERGVHERIVIDGITSLFTLKTDPVFVELYNHPNVEVKFYNLPNLLTPWTLNYRLHEKVVKVDDTFLVVGGRNSMNNFLGNYGDQQKLDRDVLVYNTDQESDLMETVQRHFDAYWNYDKCTDASPWVSSSCTLSDRWNGLVAANPSITESRTWSDITYAVDDVAFITGGIEATNKEPTLWKSICSVASTGKNVIIQTPYVMFSNEMYADLTTLCMSREVYVVTNDITEHTNAFGTMDLTHERENITSTGVTLVETQWGHFVHAKAFIVDEDISLIGSFNCDSRSAYLDNECMLVIKSTTLNQQLRSEVSQAQEVGYAQTSTSTEAGAKYDMEKRESNSIFWNIAGILTKPIRYLF